MKISGKAMAALLGLLLVAGFAGCFELVSYQALKAQQWFESWEYLTVKDETLGFTLRPNTRLRWSGVDVSINRSGVRDATDGGEVTAGVGDELLILAIGDSNTFGAYAEYERTFPSLLQAGLSRDLSRPVRVVNLGVSGYSTLQARLRLEQWMHLKPDFVVFTESFNDRHCGRADTRQVFAEEYRYIRPHEFGDSIVYSILFLQKIMLFGVASTDLPDLDEPLPQVRLTLPRFRENLEQMIGLVRRSGARMILVAYGDDNAIDRLATAGMDYLRREQWGVAEKVFERLTRIRPKLFLNWYHYHGANLKRTGMDEAPGIVGDYRKAVKPTYLTLFSHYSNEYVDEMRVVAGAHSVTLLDMRREFGRKRVKFVDVAHFDERGHRQIASALRRQIVGMIGHGEP
jgi:lysophospholipase L1-like esterase